jgi:hypothetical protein
MVRDFDAQLIDSRGKALSGTYRSVLFALAVSASLFSGCAGEGSDGVLPTSRTAVDDTESHPFGAGVAPDKVPLSVQSSSAQRDILDDGVVTYAEYESSVLAHLACLEQRGIRTAGPTSAHARTMLTWSLIPPSSMSDDDFLTLESECLGMYLSEVEPLYLEGARPDAATRVEYAEKLRKCLTRAGADLEEGLTEIEIVPRVLQGGDQELPESASFPCFREYAFHVVVPDG